MAQGGAAAARQSRAATPGRDCPRCPRLVAFRKEWRKKEPTWFNAPVPSFGPVDARLLIVGLAPGLQGANRTGRPFTGDYAGVLLYETLLRYKFARGEYAAHPDDGLDAHRLPHHQCGALRAAGEQADHRRDQDLPRFPHSDHRGDEEAARDPGARPHRPRQRGHRARRQEIGDAVQARRPPRRRRLRACFRAITARATTPTPAC